MVIDQLIHQIQEKKNPTVVGLDPRLSYIPEHIKEAALGEYGKTSQAVANMFLEFNKAIIDAVCEIVPAVKPQVAMYEQYGPEGMACYAQTIRYAKSKGLFVIGDVKRSDIASTAEAYSDGHLGVTEIAGEPCGNFAADFITVNPYLGADSIEPFLKNCRTYGKGIFVLVKTSNPGGGLFQDLKTESGALVYEAVGAYVENTGLDLMGTRGYSAIGAVVGATYPAQLEKLRRQMPHTYFLIPGYGAQGGSGADIAAAFDENGLGAVVNSSRGIIAAYQMKQYQSQYSQRQFAQAAAAAAQDMKSDLRRNIPCWKNM